MLGQAETVTVNKENTTIVNGSRLERGYRIACSQIKTRIQTTTSDYDKEKLHERLAKLAGGGRTSYRRTVEVEMKEKKDHRVDDALSATRAAIAEGIVPGGGVAYIRAHLTALDGLQGRQR